MSGISVTPEELEILMQYVQIQNNSKSDQDSKSQYYNNNKKGGEKVLAFRKQVEYGQKKRIKP